MTKRPEQDEPVPGQRFSYFMIRVHAVEDPRLDAGLSGTLERLGSGRQEAFSGASELVRLLSFRTPSPRSGSTLQADDGIGN